MRSAPAIATSGTKDVVYEKSDSLFERSAAVYIFCREKLFRDDTSRIIEALWSGREPGPSAKVLELGCGPGYYACRLARRFPHISILGVDSSTQLVRYARENATEKGLGNCFFERGDVLDLPYPDNSFTDLIASRLFTILLERERAVAEIFRVLDSGGRCFVAEPRFAFSVSVPLLIMRTVARVSGYSTDDHEPIKATILSFADFRALFATQPWLRIKTWRVGRYQYALCEKG